MRTHYRRGKGPRRGFTLIEVAFALMIFLMMALMFGAAIPVALLGTRQGGDYTEAALLAQHKMDELRTAGFSSVGSYASLQGLQIVDALNADGSYDFSTTPSDNLAAYFPSGTTGTITVAADTSTGTMQGGVYDVTVTIAWPAPGAAPGTPKRSFTLINKIINY